MKILIILIICTIAYSALPDHMEKVPGYPDDFNTSVFSGYLDLKNQSRGAHYVFVQSINGANNNDPVTLWLNGGPGCSSLLGFLQQIGPYYLEEGKNYERGDKLTQNPHSWHKVSNLLFLQSPAGVGFSYNTDLKYQNDDENTAEDNFNALLSFFQKYPGYAKRAFWIAGQSYAGKYIPDLAVKIDKYNDASGSNHINFKGIMVGNGIMSFQDGELQNSQIEYMVGHSFIDPEILSYWKSSCQVDPESAGCGFFIKRFQQNTEEINPYNVYGYCFYNDSFDGKPKQNGKPSVLYTQETLLLKRLAEQSEDGGRYQRKFNGAPCAYFDGMLNYFNLHHSDYHAKFIDQKWNGPCAENITYHIDQRGSMASYRYLLSRVEEKMLQIVLYNGDWDDVVPYHDTIKGIENLNLVHSYLYQPWFTNDQHSGFQQLYSGILFVTVKGASHQVPQSKRQDSLQLFSTVLGGHKTSIPSQHPSCKEGKCEKIVIE